MAQTGGLELGGGVAPPGPPLLALRAQQSWGQNLFQNSVFLNKSADWTSLHHLNFIWLSWTSSTPKKIHTAIPLNMVCLTAPHLFLDPIGDKNVISENVKNIVSASFSVWIWIFFTDMDIFGASTTCRPAW